LGAGSYHVYQGENSNWKQGGENTIIKKDLMERKIGNDKKEPRIHKKKEETVEQVLKLL